LIFLGDNPTFPFPVLAFFRAPVNTVASKASQSMRELLKYFGLIRYFWGAGAVIAFFSMVVALLNWSFPLIYLIVFDWLLPTQDAKLQWITVFAAMAFSVFIVLFSTLSELFVTSLRLSSIREIRTVLIGRMIDFNQEFFQKNLPGDLIQRLVPEVDTIGTVMAQLFRSFGSLFEIGLMIILLAFLNKAALLAYAIFAMFYLAWNVILKKMIVRQRLRQSGEIGKIYESYFEMLTGVKQIKCMNLGIQQVRAVTSELGRVRHSALKGASLDSTLILGPTLAARTTFLAGMVFSFLQLKGGQISLGVFIWSLLLMNRLAIPFQQLSVLASALNSGIGSAQRLKLFAPENLEKSGRVRFNGLENGIDFQSVNYRYSADRNVLDGLSLSIPRASNVAIVGESGSGKSTLIHLLLRLKEPKQGFIKIDGRDISEYDLRTLRQKIGLVTQDVFLFNDSIRRNIDIESRLSETRLLEICKMCQLSGLISKSKQGLDTVVGERGSRLSGGEKQRIAIARVIAKDANIIVLDEATSALDPKVETEIKEMLSECRKSKPNLTIITISHRPSIIFDADIIFVLEKGKVAEKGNHSDLLAGNSLYFRLFSNRDGRVETKDKNRGMPATRTG
jgi:subfamily B ATP-binding cassette protein MsbA